MPGKTVLIIDDDPAFRENLGGVLRAAGYRVVEAHDGPGALTAMDELRGGVDLMIVDLCLPDDVNGLDIILAATRRKIEVKIIAASAVFDQLYLDMATSLGADVAIRKPVGGEIGATWLEMVRRLVGESAVVSAPSQQLVVLADDEAGVRGFVRSVLQHAGYQVLEAEDGEAALNLIEKIGGALDLLVTDYQMPNMVGTRLVQAMRAKYPAVPVVYISGYASGVDGEQLNDPANACLLVPKPFLPNQFLTAVKGLLAKSSNG